MRYDYDAIVIGGRVAGASTAMLLARRGHRVLVVDRATMPADTVSTHAILRTGVLQLTRWGVIDRVIAGGTPPIRQVTLGFGEERIRFALRDDHGIEELYAPRRVLLDSILLDEAVGSGASLAAGTQMTDLLRDGTGRVIGAELNDGRQTSQVTAPVVIGADGVRSRVARLVEAAECEAHAPSNAVHYAYFEGVEADGFWFQFTPGINAGLIPTNDGATCVFVGRPPSLLGAWRQDSDAEFGRLLEDAGTDLAQRVAGANRVSPYRGTTGLPGFLRQAWGPGWALVGDAGYTKDPISAHGISDALRDAELCARAVDQTLGGVAEDEAMGWYQRRRDLLSRPMLHESRLLAAYAWGPDEASSHMRRISDAVRAECDMLAKLPAWPGALASASA